jgi:hypothetical protein
MRKVVSLLFVAVALAATGVALSSGGPNEKLVSRLRVYGGGQFGPGCTNDTITFCLPSSRSFALDAHADGHGNGAVYGTWDYGPTAGPWHISGEITCMKVVGNTAIFGGLVRQSERPELLGLTFAGYVRDNGTPAAGVPDQASIGWFGTSDGMAGDFPTTFPATCPATGAFGADVAPAVWFDLQGDVTIQP